MGKRTGKPRGRPQGSKSKSTREREEQMLEAKRKAESALGEEAFDGNAHDLLMLVYKNTALPLDIRVDAAKAAISYEKPKLSSIDANVTMSPHEDTLEALADDGDDD